MFGVKSHLYPVRDALLITAASKLIFGKTFAASHKRALASLWRRRFKPFLVHASEELVGQFLR